MLSAAREGDGLCCWHHRQEEGGERIRGVPLPIRPEFGRRHCHFRATVCGAHLASIEHSSTVSHGCIMASAHSVLCNVHLSETLVCHAHFALPTALPGRLASNNCCIVFVTEIKLEVEEADIFRYRGGCCILLSYLSTPFLLSSSL